MTGTAVFRKNLTNSQLRTVSSQIAAWLGEVDRVPHIRRRTWVEFQSACNVLIDLIKQAQHTCPTKAITLLEDVKHLIFALPDDFAAAGLASDTPGLPLAEAEARKERYIISLSTILAKLGHVEHS